MVRGEADRSRIGRDVGKSQRLPFFDQRAQDAAAVRGGADRFTLLGGDAGGATDEHPVGSGRSLVLAGYPAVGRDARGLGGADSWTWTLASTMTAPYGSTITGLQSISAIDGWASTIVETRRMTSSSAATSAFGAPRYPSRSGNVFRERTISEASRSVIGAILTETSRRSSAAVPPALHATTGPKSGSWATPTSISTPPVTISWTRNPSSVKPASSTRRAICFAAEITSSGPASPRRTAPTSVLCTMSRPNAFRATGPPRLEATAAATSGVAARAERATRSPQQPRSSSSSSAVNQPPPRPKAPAITAYASSRRTSSNRGAVPSGLVRHCPYAAARATAMAACSGNENEGIFVPSTRSSDSTAEPPINVVATGMLPPTS